MLNYVPDLDRVFQALADPGRRLMVERLSQGPASVSELGRPLDMSLAAVLQHVQVLEASGLIRSQKAGRTPLRGGLDRRPAHRGRAPPRPARRVPGADRRPARSSPGHRARPDEQRPQGAAMTGCSVIHDTFSIERTYPA